MGDVRAERVEDELAGLRGDRDVGEIYDFIKEWWQIWRDDYMGA